MSIRTNDFQSGQITSSFINQINNNRFFEFQEVISAVEKELGVKLAEQDVRFLEALTYSSSIRDFISNPNRILGSMETKHGEIAEQVEVGIRNARDALKGKDIMATFDGIGRTAPADYQIGDVLYQSKYINGTRNTLNHVFEHMKKYEDFKLGENTRYHIPKDQYELIKKIIDNEDIEGLNSRTILSIKRKISEIEEITGKSFYEKIEAGDSSYSEIQIRTVGDTIDKHEVNLSSENDRIKEDFKEEANKKKQSLNHIKEPNIEEAFKSGLIGAGVSGTLKFGFNIYRKYKDENKHIYEYDQEDWKEIGLDVGKSGIKGGVTGVGIYGLTNFALMPAPVAGGYVSAVFCTIELMKKYKKGEMEIEDFLIESECICVEAGLTMSCALIGQAMIPIPIIGAIVGSIVGSIMSGPIMNSAKEYLSEKEIKLIKDYNIRYQQVISRLTKVEKEYCLKIVGYFEKIEHLENFVFDSKVNSLLRLSKSAEIAVAYEVDPKLIVRSIKDVDALFE